MGADAIFRVAWSVAVVDWWFPIGLNINNEAPPRIWATPTPFIKRPCHQQGAMAFEGFSFSAHKAR
jgi:hypothetical protein